MRQIFFELIRFDAMSKPTTVLFSIDE